MSGNFTEVPLSFKVILLGDSGIFNYIIEVWEKRVSSDNISTTSSILKQDQHARSISALKNVK